MEVAAHIEALRLEGERMADAAGAAAPTQRCPRVRTGSCATWSGTLGGVHRWATGYRGRRPDRALGRRPRRGRRHLARRRRAGDVVPGRAAPPGRRAGGRPADLECWTFLPRPVAPGHVGRGARPTRRPSTGSTPSWRRAAAPSARSAPAFAADGVDELLCVLRAPAQHPAACRAADHAGRARAPTPTPPGCCGSTPRGVTTERRTRAGDGPRAGRQAACTVRGRRRISTSRCGTGRGAEALAVEGDRAVLDLFLESVQVRWA